MALVLQALFALGALAASTASAEEGFLPAVNSTGSGGTQILETLGGEKIQCTAISILEGTPTNDKEGTANVHFSGCTATALKVAVNSLGDEAKVILTKIHVTACLVNSTSLTFGVVISPSETVHVEIPSVKELLLAKGQVIAELEGAGLEKSEFKYSLSGEKGDQKTALKCETEGKKFEQTLAASKDSAKEDEMMSASGATTIKFGESVKLMDA